jgi:hypothetical protein
MFAAILAPVAALALIKPVRVAVPRIVNGVRCYDDEICTDDKQRLGEARTLYSAAFARVSENAGAFHSRPRIIFCSADSCRKGFGLGERAAYTAGGFGIAVAPRGWREFYLAHEFVHYRQAEELGGIIMLWKPKWLIEGMAYSLSEDPRRSLSQPFERWRTEFESWNIFLSHTDFWQAAKNVK